MANKMRLRVATPENAKFDNDVEMVIMRCISGDMGILPHHEAASAILDDGVLRIMNDGGERRMAVFGGIAQIRNNTVTLIANDAKWPEEIDVASVGSDLERLTDQMKEEPDSAEQKRCLVLMRRCSLQLEVGNYSTVN